jgi:hypothetical protein
MKFFVFVLAAVISISSANAQLKAAAACPPMKIDILEGTINNKLYCTSTSGEVQKLFPCFTSVVEETNGTTCGGVIYKDKDIAFYTERDYIEIGAGFKGTLEPAIMGGNRTQLFKLLGNPKIKDATWEAYQTKYGILVLYFDANSRINKIQISSKSADSIKLCE